jgi:hypothetical protein
MPSATDYQAIFTKPSAPSSDWETFKWMFFESSLLEKYSKNLSRKEAAWQFTKVYFKFILPLVGITWLLFIGTLVATNLPETHPDFFRFGLQEWIQLESTSQQFLFLIHELAFGLALGLALGLAAGLAGGLAFGLAEGLAVGLAAGLGGGLALGLAFGLAGDLAGDLAVGLAVGLAFYVGQLRLLFYPVYVIFAPQEYKLITNPYLYDEGIWLPLPWVKRALLKEAVLKPDIALAFADFLFRYRKLQYGLAHEITHTAIAAYWKNQLRLKADDLKIIIPLSTLVEVKKDDQQPDKYLASTTWKQALLKLHETLLQAESQTAVVLKKRYYLECTSLLKEIQAIHLRETFRGRDAYFSTFENWEKLLANQIAEVEQEIECIQSVSLNPYSKGNALAPQSEGAQLLFLEREDIKNELTLKIQTSAVMPTFLLVGQRRTGKTSLLNFLPRLLDRSRYAVAVLDAQGMSGELSVSSWLTAWRDRVNTQFGLPTDEEPLPEDWLEAWDTFANYTETLAKEHQRKIILVMEEYDDSGSFHHALHQSPERAGFLLARIRAFSQRQNEVILMFVGATSFRDLPGEPQWVKYFTQIHTLRIDYLSRAGTLQLITEPLPGFRLKYAEGLPERIWELTQGHPHLLHSICSDLVDFANVKAKNPVDHADLDHILQEKTLQADEQPFVNFWEEFCALSPIRAAVLTLCKNEPVDETLPEVRRLLEYKYIVRNPENGQLQMRVPLFQEWVLLFGY